MAGGDTYTIIYLKMQLLSLQNGGKLVYEGIEDDFVNELALNIDEKAEDIQMTVLYLVQQGLLIEGKDDEFSLPETINAIGSETASTIRSRKSRTTKTLQCNTDATLLQHDATKCNGDIDIEIDIHKDINNTSVRAKTSDTTQESPIITLTLNDKSEYGVDRIQVQEWQELYPAVDVVQELRKMKGWLNANPQKRKTRRGISRFINGWLSREQDKGHQYVSKPKNVSKPKTLPEWYENQDYVETGIRCMVDDSELKAMMEKLKGEQQ